MGLIEITGTPKLIPFIKSENKFAKEGFTPIRMREIWLWKRFEAERVSTGFYYWIPDKSKPKISKGGRTYPQKELKSFGEVHDSWKWVLKYDEGLRLLKEWEPQEFIQNWYKRSWPEKSDFIFNSLEIRDLEVYYINPLTEIL